MKRKRKNSIITTLALICAIIMITLLPLPIAEAANFTVSKSNVSIENGKSSTITIKAPTHTGRIDIISSNSNIATVSDSSLWVENNSKTITISAKSTGTATITIKGELYDESIGEEAEYIRTINVTVTKAANSSNAGTSGNNASSIGGSNTSGSSSGSNAGTSTGNGNTGSNAGGTQSSESASSNNQNSNTGTSSSSGQSTAKPIQSTTNVNVSPSTEQTATIEENNEEQITNEAEELIEEVDSEEVPENIIEDETEQLQSANIEKSTSSNSKGKMIIISVIGAIALIMIFLGIGISKNILKK